MSSRTVKLFVNPLSQPSRTLLAFANLAKVNHEVVMINLADRQNVADVLTPINPKSQVPVL